MTNEKHPVATWPRESRGIETALILTVILTCVGLFCLAIHIPKMAKVLSEGVREIVGK